MQVDWAVIRRGSNRLSVFVATLGWSRAAYVEFVTDERVETLIEAHEDAFLSFGGTPPEVLYDNMRTIVLERHGYGRGRYRFHPGFLDFARHCGFRPRPCAPYRAQTKGKVERFIRYLRHSFYVPLASRLAQEGLIVDRADREPGGRPMIFPRFGGHRCQAFEPGGRCQMSATRRIFPEAYPLDVRLKVSQLHPSRPKPMATST